MIGGALGGPIGDLGGDRLDRIDCSVCRVVFGKRLHEIDKQRALEKDEPPGYEVIRQSTKRFRPKPNVGALSIRRSGRERRRNRRGGR